MKHFMIFISMPMNGLSKAEIDKKFAELKPRAIEAAKNYLEELEVNKVPQFHVADSVYHEDVPEFIKSSGLYCLGWSLQVLSGCDFCYFAEGWENARGCKIEHQAAIDYGITVCEDYQGNVESNKEKS